MANLCLRACALGVAIVGLAACSGSLPQANTQTISSQARSARATIAQFARAGAAQTVYISVAATSSVLEYRAGVDHPRLIGTITSGVHIPLGVATDSAGTLYVLNTAGQNHDSTVTEYPAGATSPSVTITVPGNAFEIAVGPNGTIYLPGYTSAGDGVLEYFAGATSPSLDILAPSQPPAGIGYIAVDEHNVLYVQYAGGSCCGIWTSSYVAGSTKPRNVYGMYSIYGAMAFDNSDNLLTALHSYTKHEYIIHVDPLHGGPITTFKAPPMDSLSLDFRDGLLYETYGTATIVDYATHQIVGSFVGIYDATGIAVGPQPY